MRAAKIAQEDGIKVYTIGLNSEVDPRSFSGMFLNANGMADLDEDTLQKIAEQTGGKYFRATSPKSLENIYHYIDKMAKVSQEQKTVRPQHEYYPWFLALGVLLFLYLIAKQSGLNKPDLGMRGTNVS